MHFPANMVVSVETQRYFSPPLGRYARNVFLGFGGFAKVVY